MSDPISNAAQPDVPRLPLIKILAAIANISRWHILRELAKGESLPVSELGHRLRATPTAMSKHCAVLLNSGIVRRGYGGLYGIDKRFLVPNERLLDLGYLVIRLDRMG